MVSITKIISIITVFATSSYSLPACSGEDSISWNLGDNVDKNCIWIAMKPNKCKNVNTEGISGFDACPAACGVCCDDSLSRYCKRINRKNKKKKCSKKPKTCFAQNRCFDNKKCIKKREKKCDKKKYNNPKTKLKSICAKSCGKCKITAPTSKPTPAPTSKPTPAPTSKPTPAPTSKPTPAPTSTTTTTKTYSYSYSSNCPSKCMICLPGGSEDGGVDLHNDVCHDFCSVHGYCGVSEIYKIGGTDCTDCHIIEENRRYLSTEKKDTIQTVNPQTTPDEPFQKFPVLPDKCDNPIYAEPVKANDVVPWGHRRMCEHVSDISFDGREQLKVISGSFVGQNAEVFQIVTAQFDLEKTPQFFNYALIVEAALSMKCTWPDGTTTQANVFIQAQNMAVVHQCDAPLSARKAKSVRLWSDKYDLTLDICDHPEEYPRIFDVTFCTAPIFGKVKPSYIVEWFELNRRHWTSSRAVLYLNLEKEQNEKLKNTMEWYISSGLIELVEWDNVRPVEQDSVEKDQWEHRMYHDQVLMYNHCLNRYRSTSNWIFNLDTDEIVDGLPNMFLGRDSIHKNFENETAVELQTIAHTGQYTEKWFTDSQILRQYRPITTDWHRPKTVYKAMLVNFAWIHGISWNERDACSFTKRLNSSGFWIRHYVDLVESDRCNRLEHSNPCNVTTTPPTKSINHKWGVDGFTRKKYDQKTRFIGYVETEGLNNQRIALENARTMAEILGRTLILPEVLFPHDNEDDTPTYTCHVFDCESIGVPWIGRAQFTIENTNSTTIRCEDIESCENLLIYPPEDKVIEISTDKVMFHMSLASPKRWTLTKLQEYNDIATHTVRANNHLINVALMLVMKLPYEYDAAHLRMGDTFSNLYPKEVRASHERISKLITSEYKNKRPIFLMTREVPKEWNVTTGHTLGVEEYEVLSLAEKGVVDQIVSANARHFYSTGMSSMSEYVLRLRATRPPWSVLSKLALDKDPNVLCNSMWCVEKSL